MAAGQELQVVSGKARGRCTYSGTMSLCDALPPPHTRRSSCCTCTAFCFHEHYSHVSTALAFSPGAAAAPGAWAVCSLKSRISLAWCTQYAFMRRRCLLQSRCYTSIHATCLVRQWYEGYGTADELHANVLTARQVPKVLRQSHSQPQLDPQQQQREQCVCQTCATRGRPLIATETSATRGRLLIATQNNQRVTSGRLNTDKHVIRCARRQSVKRTVPVLMVHSRMAGEAIKCHRVQWHSRP